MANKKQHISFKSNRRFGVELELNAFDGRNRPASGNTPEGIYHIADVVSASDPDVGAEVRPWEHTNNNNKWVVKPDSSCGLEVVSPPFKGWSGLKHVISVASGIEKDVKIKADHRCSVHVHVEVADLNESQIASVVAWWIKCEPVMMDAMPMERKRNRYCQLIGMNNSYQHDGVYAAKEIIQKIGDVKYYSMNTHQYTRGGRKTIEFRTIEGAGCKDAYLIKQWIRFLIHFVEMTAAVGIPKPYHHPKDDDEKRSLTPWTGWAWLDPDQVLDLLGFNRQPSSVPGHRSEKEFALSNGMEQTRNWFVGRLMKYMSGHKQGGMRYKAYERLYEIVERDRKNGYDICPDKHTSPTEKREEELFGEHSRI